MSKEFDKTFDFNISEIKFREYLEFAPVGLLIFHKDFTVRFVNQNFFKFPGVLEGSPSSLIGKSIYKYRIFEELDLRKDLKDLENGIGFEKELNASKTLGGGKISILLKCLPISVDGIYNGGVIVVEDIKVDIGKSDDSMLHSGNFQNFLSLISDYFFLSDWEGNVKLLTTKSHEDFDFLFEPETFKSNKGPHRLSSILFKKLLESVVKENKTVQTQIPYIKKSRQQKAVITLIPFGGSLSKVESIIVLVKNAVESEDNKQLEPEEIQELNRYQKIVSNVLDGVIGLNNEGKITFWNESCAVLFGLTRSEVYGKFIGKIFSQINIQFFDQLKAELKIKKTWEGEFRIGEEEGIAEYFIVKFGLLDESDDNSIVALCSNITKRIKIERDLRKSEERFRNIVTNSHEFICTLDLNGKVSYANPHFLHALMYNESEMYQMQFVDLIDPEYLNSNNFSLSDLQRKQNQFIEIPLLTKLGRRIYVFASISIVYDLTDIPQYYNVILTDITLKKESEKDLLLIRSIFEASLDGIALLSKKRFVLVNDSFVKMFGFFSASEILGEDPIDFVDEKDADRIAEFIDLAENGDNTNERYQFTAKRQDASTFEVENSVSFYQTEDENFIVWVLRDITAEVKAQQELQLSEERYRSIIENINDSFWTAEKKDGNLKSVFYTPAIKNITGYSYKEFIDDSNLWKKIIHPDDVESIVHRLHRLYNNHASSFESFEYRIIDKLGNVIWIRNKITVNRDQKGETRKIFGIVSDISLAKRAEEELKKSSQDLKELNEAKDRFISIISHDLRSPFSSILGFTDFLLTEKDLDEEKRDQYTRFIQESAKSMLSMVNSLLDWTRLQTGRIKFEPERMNARIVIDKVIQILAGAALQKEITMQSELQKDYYIHADEGLLMQVFNNLISNAIKFTKNGGIIRVKAAVDVEKRQAKFSVKDDGVGIRKEDLEKLFKVDAKFTTPGTSGEKGSGLGLSLVQEIVQKHGGEIWVESIYGEGAEFIFTIPVASNYILLCDDVNMDRLLYTKLLKNLIPGYTVIDAENGKVAFEKVQQFSPALIITDHNMPEMNGLELVRQVRNTELKYKPPIIVLSSDIDKNIEESYKYYGVEFVFSKPVNLSNFKSAIEKSLKKAVYS